MAKPVLKLAQASLNPLDAINEALLKRGESYEEVENIPLGPDEEGSLCEQVIRDFEDNYGANMQFYQNMLEMTANWRGTTDAKIFPFEGSANLRVPITSSFIEQTKARMLKALFGSGQFCKLFPVDKLIKPEDIQGSNDWLDWEMREVVHLHQVMKDVIHNVLINGIGVVIPNYEHRTRMLKSRRTFDLQDQQPIDAQLEQALKQIIATPTAWSAERDAEVEVTGQTDHGVYKLSDGGKIEFCIRTQSGKSMLCADVMRNETIYDGAKLYCINLEDLNCPNSASNIEDIPYFGIRYFDNVADFRQQVEDGFYHVNGGKEQEERIARLADIKIGDYFQQEQSKRQDEEEGTDSRDLSGYRPNRLWIEVYRWEGWWVWDKSGAPLTRDKALAPATQVAAWVVPRARKVIKLARLESLNKDGKRSGVKFNYIREPNRFISIGMAEWLRHIQAELDAIHNQRIDAGLLTNAPFGFYEAGSGMKKEILTIEPGKLKPVKNAQGVYFPPLNWQPRVSQQDEEMVWTYAQGQGGLTDQAMGVPISKRQSASEFVGTASALDIRTEMILDDFMDSFRELVYRILGLYQQFGPRRRMYRVQGEEGDRLTRHFELDRLDGRIEVVLASNLQQVNEQMQKQVATDMLQLLLNEVLVSLQIVGPDTIYAAVDKLAKSMHYTGVPIHKPQSAPQSDAPNIEHARIANGLPIGGPNQGENFQEHLQAHLMLASDPHINEKLSMPAQQALGDHIKQTVEMQQQVAVLKGMMAAQAVQMAQSMASKGIKPGKPGDMKPGANAGAGTAAEGVGSGAPGAAG